MDAAHRMPSMSRPVLAAALAVALASPAVAGIPHPDHYEFDASIAVPFRAQSGRFPMRLRFDYPGAGDRTAAAWTLDVIAPDGRIVTGSRGVAPLHGRHVVVPASWNGRTDDARAAPPGYYTLRLRAVPTLLDPADTRPVPARVDEAFRLFGDEAVEQRYDVQVGAVAPARVTPRAPLPVGAQRARPGIVAQAVPSTGGLGYTVYYGNLHSQTNHSDGGVPVAQCGGAENPQAGTLGPADAYAMMQTQARGDFLLTSEHNHMYDGSTGTNTSASPTTAINLFRSGLAAASDYRAAHPGFLAMYGLEWGVISNGGHLNLLNANALPTWETNASGQLLGEVNTPKSDYASLYATMKARGWIGMFNHPAQSGQFQINGTPLAYDANGAQVMVLAEIVNSAAFSTNTTETETARSNYVAAWNMLLERGYKVAPASDQDNHCANWGLSFTNRTGVLLPSGATLDPANFEAALRARRTFATEDRTGQLVLTANGHVMGESFASSGPLTLTANFASTSGQMAQRVQFFEGVPGRNGTVTQLYEGSDTTTITPANGEHFYYVQVTQANGLRLWSAPVWVSQGAAPSDTQAPTVSASESGSAGTITLAATASDNVGVARVEFHVDGVLKATDTTAPYASPLDSTTLANGSHTLVAKAFDAAGNVGTSAPVAFSVNNGTTATELVRNGGFESGSTGWTATSGTITNSSSYAAHGGTWKLWLNGYGSANTEYGYQTLTIPSTATTATFSFWLRVASSETTTTTAYDTLKVQLRSTGNSVLATLATYSNLNKGSTYVQRSFDVSAYRGQTVRIHFEGTEGAQVATSFLIDDVSVSAK